VINRLNAFMGLGILLLSSLTSYAADSESGWFYRAWQTDDGLPANSVTGVSQTPEGRLWVATHGGLVTFDGIRFREVNLPMPSGRLLPIIRCLTQDRAHRLWLAFEGGIVACVQPSGNQVRLFTPANGLPSFRPTSLVTVADGAVWISYADGLACRLAGETVTRLTARDGLVGTGHCTLANDNKGNVWFAKAGQCGILDEKEAKPLFAVPPGTVRLAAAREGGVWICCGNRLLHAASTTNQPVEVGEVPFTTPGIEPAALYEDRAGDVWIGTLAGGLFRYDGTEFEMVETSHADVLALTEDREGNVWVGTDGGGGYWCCRAVIKACLSPRWGPFARTTRAQCGRWRRTGN
jgi:ligand-binding sensor domain-containing protein